MKKKRTKKRKSVRVKRMSRQRTKHRRITAAQARRVAMLYDARLRFRGAKVQNSLEPGTSLPYPFSGRDCWIVHPKSIGQPGHVGGSYLICVDKRTGKVLYAGLAGE